MDATFQRPDFSLSRLAIGGPLLASAMALGAVFALYVAATFAGGLTSFPAGRDDAAIAEDLVAFHRAGEMALRGEAGAAYDPAAFRAGLADHQKGLLWLNPPHAYFVMAPLAMLPYGAAKFVWMALGALSLAGILAAAKFCSRPFFLLALVSPAMLISTMLLQLGAFIAVGLAAALSIAPRRPILAGVLLALLTMKPQYGLMAPVFLLATGQWRAIFATAIASAILVALSAALFGAESWGAFFEALKTVHGPFARQILEGTATFSQTAAKLGAGDAARVVAQIAGIGLGALVVWFAARRLPANDALALTLLFSLAAAPSAWIYDWPLVIAAMAFLAGRPAWPVMAQAGAGALWLAPLIPTFSDSRFAGLAPALALYAFTAVATLWLFRRTA